MLTKWKYELSVFDLYDKVERNSITAQQFAVEVAARIRTLPPFHSDKRLQQIANSLYLSKTNDSVDYHIDALCQWGEQIVDKGIFLKTRLCHIKTT